MIKRHQSGSDLLELHPLVRNFIRQNFSNSERLSYIDRIINVYKNVVGRFKYRLKERPPLSVLQYWTQIAELDIATGNTSDAFATLAEVIIAFMLSAYPRVLIRVTRLLFASVDWVKQHEQIKDFEIVFRNHTRLLSQLGETREVDQVLDQYELTVPERDIRYISYYEMRSHSMWFRGAFGEAVSWAREGQKLVEDSQVDSESSITIRHMRALAERDAGRPEIALPMFLDGRTLSEVIDPDELDSNRSEHHYGNIGRCLQFMGQIEHALICYQKSALVIEKGGATESVMNKAYARMWIGELLYGREELSLAYAFLQSAFDLWQKVSPPKCSSVLAKMTEIESRMGRVPQRKDSDVEQLCLEWILGGHIETNAATVERETRR